MTKRERILKTLNFEKSSAIDLGGMASTGISCFAYPHLVESLGLPPRLPRVYDTGQMLALPDIDVLDALNCDVVTVCTDSYTNAFEEPERWFPYDFNGRLPAMVQKPEKFSADPDGTIIQTDSQDVLKMVSSSYVFDSPHGGQPLDIMSLDPPKEDLKKIEEDLKESLFTSEKIRSISDYCISVRNSTDRAVFFNGLKMPLHFRGGMASWSMFCLTDPEYVKSVHELITRYSIENINRLLPEIAPYIDINMSNSDDQGTQNAPILPPHVYRELYVPYYRRMNDALHSHAPELKSFLHSCGAIYDLIDDVIDGGFDILNPVQWSAGGHSYKEWKDKSRNRISLWGGGVNSQATLPLGTVDDVYREVGEVCSYLNEDGGFVFNSIHNILAEIPAEKIKAMYRAAAEKF
jgi:uroporphyrinogen decarboxylase